MANDSAVIRPSIGEPNSFAADTRYRAIFDRAGVGLVLIDQNCNIFDANEAFCAIVGRNIQELIGTTCMAITHAEDVPTNEEVIARLANPSEQTATFEKRYIRPDGDNVWVRINLSKIPFDEGERVLAVVEDISDRKAAEAALQQSEERLRRVLETDAVGVIFFNHDGVVIGANQAFLGMTGYTRERIARGDLNWRVMTPPEWVPASEEQMVKLGATGKIGPYEKEYILADGTRRWMLFAGRDLGDGTIAEYCLDITNRKQVEEALKESEAHLSAIVNQTAAGVAETDLTGRFTNVNGRYCAIVGRSRDELLTMRMQDITHPDDLRGNVKLFERAIKTGEPFHIEKRYIRPDGSEVWVSNTVNLIRDDSKDVASVVAVTVDVTERRRAEEALRDSEERLRLAVDNADVGFWDVEEGHGALTWPPRTKAMFGISPDVPVSMEDFYKGLHPDDLPDVAEAYTAAADPAKRTLYDVEYRTIGKEDGVLRWVAAKGRGIFDGEGPEARCLRVVGTAIDITQRKETERALREESHNLEILNRTGAAIAAELDLEKVVQLVTDAGVELTGAKFGAFFYNVVNTSGESYMLYTLSGVPRSTFERFPMPRNTKVFGPTFDGEGVVRSDDITKDPRYGQNAPHFGMPEGHLPVVSYLAVPVISRTGEVVGGLFFGHQKARQFREHHERLMGGIAAQAAIAIDNARLYGAAQHEIGQRVRAEEALTALNETLESRVAEEVQRRARAEEVLRQAQKMETVGQLSGGIAHDFNNLLQVIHGNLSALDRSIPAHEEKLRRAVGNALTGTERAASLTKRLLAFSRRQSLDPRPIDVNRLIRDMTELLQRTLGETIAVETDLSPGVPNALVDGNQLENAILNLAINARDAMPRGGSLEICTAAAELDPEYVSANPEATAGRHVCISVKDTGHGMEEEVRSHAIEPFYSTKEVGEGTGLGLSMVYGFVRQSGGHLVLNSTVGKGTTVELYLPASDEAAQRAAEPVQASELPLGRGECVLVCEDDKDVRSFSTETLTDLGYSVLQASDSATALSVIIEKGRIDLLFTDVILPGGRTGADLAREARKLQPDLKVLFTTGYARSALDKEQDGDRSIDILLKPFGVEELAVKVRQVLG